MKPFDLCINDNPHPLGLDDPRPAFSWKIPADERGVRQACYRILISTDSELLHSDVGDIWDSGEVPSSDSTCIRYNGQPLEPARTYWWQVGVRYSGEGPLVWGEPSWFGTGLLTPDDWRASWIGRGPEREPHIDPERFVKEGELLRSQIETDHRSTLLRKGFRLAGPVKAARVFVTGLGFYELRVNGRKIGGSVLAPSRTDYRYRVLYDGFDVHEILRPGRNAFGIILGDGWWNPSENNWNWRYQWHGSPRAILECHVQYENGEHEVIVSDNTWKTATGPIAASCIYDGEQYDARLEQPGWDRPHFDDSAWATANLVEPPDGRLCFHDIEPIEVAEHVRPVSVREVSPGVHVFDMGQNFAGWARLRVSGPSGATVTLRFTEDVHPDGTLDNTTSADADQTDTYTLKGTGDEVWEPRFTYHGFQYVEVTGYPGVPSLDSLTGCVVRSACREAGEFSCSNEVVNHIHRCTVWSQKSNMMGLPTDDCQRAERLGWMGDAHVAFHQAACKFDATRFYRKWLNDAADAQYPDSGDIPFIAPRPIREGDSPCWSSAYPLICWYGYCTWGDLRFLSDHYDGLRRYVDFLYSTATDCILPPDPLADWCSCAPGWKKGEPALASTWYFYYDTLIVAEAARLLVRDDDARTYRELAGRTRDAFNRRFLNRQTGAYDDGSQCAQIMPLYLDMPPANADESVRQALLRSIEDEEGGHLLTGILGTRYALELLDRMGRRDLSWRLASGTEQPSWGHMTRGRTTLSEAWDATAGTHNHIMFGCVDAWYFETLAGIRIDESKPWPDRLTLAPYFEAPLENCRAARPTVRGRVASEWCRNDNTIHWTVRIPGNATAKLVIDVPPEDAVIREGSDTVWDKGRAGIAPGMTSACAGAGGRGVELVVGAGHYRLSWDMQ